MSINEKLTEWGINIPADAYAPEYLLDSKAENCFFAGRIPLELRDNNREEFDRLDYSYADVIGGAISPDAFSYVEKEYLGFLSRLCEKNSVTVYTFENSLLSDKSIRYLDKAYRNKLNEKLLADDREFPVLTGEDLEMWNQACLRDVVIPTLVFEPARLLVTPCWSCYLIYLNDLKCLESLNVAARSERFSVSPALKK